MAIEYRDRTTPNGNPETAVVMTACPFCGTDIEENRGFADHAPYCSDLGGSDGD